MKKLKLKQSLCLLFMSFAVLILGACSLFINGGITYYSVIGTIQMLVPAVLILGLLGWLTGSMIESSKNMPKDIGYTNTLLEDLLKEAGIDGSNQEIPHQEENNNEEEL